MRIGLLVDRMEIAVWQARALETLGKSHEYVVYNCLNTRAGRRRLKHAFYYLLNLFTIRNPLTRQVPLAGIVRGARQHDFDAEADRSWQRLPASLLATMRGDRPDVILKFGLSLLRIPPREELPVPILSYHHGDPRRFRGRPAGFWELCHKASAVGQIVQILSNRLDAGGAVAFAETKAHAYSYRRTLLELYGHSPLLLRRAIENALADRVLPLEPTGRNYRLPGNWTVLRLVARLWGRAVRRLLYGMFLEKAWSVSTCVADPESLARGEPQGGIPAREEWRTLETPRGYAFLADPFYEPGTSALLLEALNARRGAGELVRVTPSGEVRSLARPGRHMSYPAAFRWGGDTFMIPEMSEWSNAHLFRLDGDALADLWELDLGPPRRLLDPTPFADAGHLYLFGNDAAEGANALRLWVGDRPDGAFREHPASPILISPEGGRMAGHLVRAGERLFRLGQDGRSAYGDGIAIFEVETIGPEHYAERPVGTFRFSSRRGPHTLNYRNGEAVFDWYQTRFSLLAGVRRLSGRLARD